MNKSKKTTPSHHEVEKMAKESAINFQPSIKRWLNKTTAAAQTGGSNCVIGACIAAMADKTKINKATVSFENRVREMNNEYNAKIKAFKKADETFRIVATNVNSITTLVKRQKIWNLLRGDPDILLLTDTRTKKHDLLTYGGNKRSIFSTDTDYRGVAFIVKKCYEPEEIETDNETGNMLTLTFKLAGKKHGLIGIYGPCEDNPQFFTSGVDNAIKKLKKNGASEIIIAGDMNIQLGKRFGYANKTLRKKNALDKLMAEHHLNDHVTELATFTNTSPISFWRKNTETRSVQLNEKYQASRLDQVLSSYPSVNIYTKYTRFYPSDHAINETCIKIKSRSGQTPWRLNRASIDDETIEKRIKKMAKKLTNNLKKVKSKLIMSNLDTISQKKIIQRVATNKWTTLVNFTKKITSVWARIEANKRSNENAKLIRCMNNLDLDNDAYNKLAEEFNRYEIEKYKIKTELYKFKNKFENKRLLKYKAQQNTTNRTMKKIRIEDDVVEDDTEIRRVLTGYFTSVFSCECEKNTQRCIRCTRNNLDYVKNIKPQIDSNKRLSNGQKSALEKPVEENEIEKYVKLKLKKEGKAPGPDGIPYIFLHKLWLNVKTIVNTIVMTVLNDNIIPESLPEGLVIFLPKHGKDPEEMNAWRPLTMLNSIYKICSGIVASRLDGVIEQIIHEHQYGFVKKRQATDVIEMINHMIKNNDDETLAIVGMDFRGAFDTVKHEAIVRALKRKNFGPNFSYMVATLMAKNNSTISVNGRIDPKLEKVKVKRSARQGDPLSPFLFILVLDELLEMIYNNEKLSGVEISNELVKGFAFADDNYTALKNTTANSIESQVIELMKIMKKFKKISGLDINVSKSEILTNDINFKEEKVSVKGIEIKSTIKSLGVEVGKNVNLGEIIKDKIKAAISFWERRKLNYIEKIDVVNCILIPKVVHLIRHCVMNDIILSSLKKSVKNFVFGSNRKVGKDEVIHSNIKDGGWGLRSIDIVWAQLLLKWSLRALKMESSLTIRSFRDFIDAKTDLDPKDQESTGYGDPIKKYRLYNCSNIWENSYNILGWVVQRLLREKVCFDHQPLLHNKIIMKQGKTIKRNDLPEIDFGSITNVEALKDNRIEIFRGRDENDKKLTRKIFLNFIPKAPLNLPPCEGDCRPPIRVLMSSKKEANDIIRCCLSSKWLDTGNKAKAAMSAYTGVDINQRNLKEHLKMSNPRNNFLLDDRCSLLRLKIRFRVFYKKLDLFRMRNENIDDPNCSYCINSAASPQSESLRHILLECREMQQVWKHFRKEINTAWRARFSFLEMVNGPLNRESCKLKSEYVFLRIINGFTGIRKGDGMDAEIRTKLIKTCDDAIRVVNKTYNKKLNVSLGDSRI